jgi:hypothetical protein
VIVSHIQTVTVGETYVKAPMRKTLMSIALFFFGKRTLNKRGIGMVIIIRSEDMFKTAFVMRWLVAAEHCSDFVSGSNRKLEYVTYLSL